MIIILASNDETGFLEKNKASRCRNVTFAKSSAKKNKNSCPSKDVELARASTFREFKMRFRKGPHVETSTRGAE